MAPCMAVDEPVGVEPAKGAACRTVSTENSVLAWTAQWQPWRSPSHESHRRGQNVMGSAQGTEAIESWNSMPVRLLEAVSLGTPVKSSQHFG